MTKKRNPQYVDSSLFVHGITLTFSMKSAKINPYIIMKNAVLCTDRGKQSKRVVLFLERAGFMETMKNIPKVSVIIPVYNVEDYVGECLECLSRQSFRDFEIIAVNDGSTDHSLQVLEQWREKLPNMRILDQENSGAAQARRAGLALAQGEYVIFADADDRMSKLYLGSLYQAATNVDADIACCNYRFDFVSGLKMIYPCRVNGVLTREDAMRKLIDDWCIQGFLWNKMYRKTLFTEHEILFPTMCFEDMIINNQLFYYANRVAAVKKPLYYYRQRKTSALNTMDAKKINDFFRAMVMVRSMLEERGEYKKYERNFRTLCFKTRNCIVYYIIQMHMRQHSSGDLMENIRRAQRAMKLIISRDVSPYLRQIDTNVIRQPLGSQVAV